MAMGKAMRAHGGGLKVAVVQFMKSGTAWWEKENSVIGEVSALKQLGVQVFSFGRTEFVHKPIPLDYKLAKEAMDKAISIQGTVDVLVLDELLNAVSFGLINESEIMEFIDNTGRTELIITGRVLSEKIRSRADQITKVVSELHPFDNGQKARKGFEF